MQNSVWSAVIDWRAMIMNNNIKIITSGIIAAVVVSLLYAVVPITESFVISHIFALIAIGGICASLCLYPKSNNIVGLGYIYLTTIYAVIGILFSIIACLFRLSGIWTFIIHIALLAIFAIIIIATSSSNNHIKRLDEQSNEKHKEFLKEKENYWK